jgi:hypothetical protein
MGYFLLKLLIILWSQVQVLVGPPIVRKPLILVSGFFHLGMDSLSIVQYVSECGLRYKRAPELKVNAIRPAEFLTLLRSKS